MATGITHTSALTDSLPVVIASARIVREYEGPMPGLVDKVTLEGGTGLAWKEVSFAKMTAQAVGETEPLTNPQQAADTPFTISPTVVGIQTLITDRVAARLSKVAFAKLGSLAQNAIQRKKDIDGLTVLDGATVSQPGAGNVLSSGVVSAMVAQIEGNTTEPGVPPFRCVLHPYQVKDLYDELTAGVGTYPIAEGETARIFRDGFKGTISSASVFVDGNITIDSSSDSKGGVFAKEAIVLVQGKVPWTKTREEPHIGGGATSVWVYDEYAYGERSAGNWLKEIYSDTTAPTS